jgi:hypothetical protein
VLAKNGAGPATAETANEARKVVELGRNDDGPFRPLSNHPQAIPAELIGSDRCLAVGYVTRGTTPILAMCRRLIEADYDPMTPLHCYRGATLAITVASIGQGAGLEINGHGTGFRPLREGGAASLVRKSDEVEGSDPPSIWRTRREASGDHFLSG